MKLELYSCKNDSLELEIPNLVRPNLDICEIFFDGEYHPWFCNWQNITFDEFVEDFEAVKNKIVEYYKAEKASCMVRSIDGEVLQRKPGYARLTSSVEEFELYDVKVIQCGIDDNAKTIKLVLSHDGCKYKVLQEK